ncbi:MAG TPA: winged helix-turn-helix transcriptional regulator [Chloroflexota bacterium]|nr:winged helix-turn-helix transcriptional regulator [Chloroflexota bacterium]
MSRSYGQYCPIARTLDLLGDKWTLLIVRELLRDRRRFRDIEAGLPGIPPNLLSYRLKALEAAGLVTREYFREMPPRVEYLLTREGRSLDSVLDELASWGADHLMQGEVPCDDVDLDLYFLHLPRFFCPDPTLGLNTTVAVELTGAGGGEWYVELTDRACTVSRAPREAEARIRCSVDTWVECMALHRDPDGLSQAPDTVFEGNVSLARSFGRFFCRERTDAAPALSTTPG